MSPLSTMYSFSRSIYFYQNEALHELSMSTQGFDGHVILVFVIHGTVNSKCPVSQTDYCIFRLLQNIGTIIPLAHILFFKKANLEIFPIELILINPVLSCITASGIINIEDTFRCFYINLGSLRRSILHLIGYLWLDQQNSTHATSVEKRERPCKQLKISWRIKLFSSVKRAHQARKLRFLQDDYKVVCGWWRSLKGPVLILFVPRGRECQQIRQTGILQNTIGCVRWIRSKTEHLIRK